MMNIHVLASGSDGNAYLIQSGNSNLLVEAGIPFKKLQQKLWTHGVKVSDLDGCLISHSHQDHCKAVPQLLKTGVECWMSRETAEELGVLPHHRAKYVYRINDNDYPTIEIGPSIIKMFDAVHDVPCLGFVISIGQERLLYLSDSAYSPYTFTGLTHLLIGVNYDPDILRESPIDRAQKARIIQSHASIETVKEMFHANDLSNLKEVHLIHISDRNGDPERFKREVQEIVGCPVYVG